MTIQEQIDLISERVEQLENEVVELNELIGGAPRLDTFGPDWITTVTGHKRRDPASPTWRPALWNEDKIPDIDSVLLADFDRFIGTLSDRPTRRHGRQSYDILLMPNRTFTVTIEKAGKSIVRLLRQDGDRGVVEQAATFDNGGFTYTKGDLAEPVLLLQVSNKPNCNSVFTQ